MYIYVSSPLRWNSFRLHRCQYTDQKMIRNRIWKFYGIKETEHGDFVYLNSISAFSQNFKTFVMRILMIFETSFFESRKRFCWKKLHVWKTKSVGPWFWRMKNIIEHSNANWCWWLKDGNNLKILLTKSLSLRVFSNADTRRCF